MLRISCIFCLNKPDTRSVSPGNPETFTDLGIMYLKINEVERAYEKLLEANDKTSKKRQIKADCRRQRFVTKAFGAESLKQTSSKGFCDKTPAQNVSNISYSPFFCLISSFAAFSTVLIHAKQLNRIQIRFSLWVPSCRPKMKVMPL